jgi:hypothetical protein
LEPREYFIIWIVFKRFENLLTEKTGLYGPIFLTQVLDDQTYLIAERMQSIRLRCKMVNLDFRGIQEMLKAKLKAKVSGSVDINWRVEEAKHWLSTVVSKLWRHL